jgi:hypothetical protein
MDRADPAWLLLIHQLPPKPAYLRVKIWRRLQALGAVAIKNTVYALPLREPSTEDLQWVLREIVAGGGEGTICEVRFVDGLDDQQVEALFHAARDADYAQIAEEARRLERAGADGRDDREVIASQLSRLRRRFVDVAAIDFFGAPGREAVDGLLTGLESRMQPEARTSDSKNLAALCARTWVTRTGIHIDRIASAWLIRRFIDPDARFKFVPAKGYQPETGELRFDMFDAEFTHVGDRCTFEVLLEHAGLGDAALQAIAEIVHDIDLKESKFDRPETSGIGHLIAGIAMNHAADEARLSRGEAVFGDLYEYFRRQPETAKHPAPPPAKDKP